MDGVSEADLKMVADLVKQATTESLQQEIGIEELRVAAQSFLNGYKILEQAHQSQQLSMLKAMIQNSNDESGSVAVSLLLKKRNADVVFTRSKFLLAFGFDDALTKFRGQVPKSAVYVYQDPEGIPHAFNMPLADLTALMNKEGRIGNPTDKFFLKAEYSTLEQEQLKQLIEGQEHVKAAQTAFQGTVNRLNRYYDVFGLSGSYRQGGRLLWLEDARKWTIAKVNNAGDLKEAYVAALMSKHKESGDLCFDDLGVAPYFSHTLIKDFFNNYIYGVTNMAAIREEDVVTDDAQYAVKGSKASAPRFNQYLTMAEAILTENIVDKDSLEAYIKERWPDDIHRNTVEKIVETTTDKTIEEIAKMLKAEVSG